MAARGDVFRPLAIVIGAYLILLAGGIRWHWAAGPPYYYGTAGLLVTFGVVAALVGLLSIWASFAIVHWSARASGLITGAAVGSGLATFFVVWNDYLIWELVVLILAQLGCMVALLSVCRLGGYSIHRELARNQQSVAVSGARASQFSVSNLLLITTALGLLFSVLHYARPASMGVWFYAILMIGGLCAAFVALAPLWASLSNHHIGFRVAALTAAAPLGGLVYAVLDYHEPLLFSWQWYAGVTTLQVLFMTLPLGAFADQGASDSAGLQRDMDLKLSYRATKLLCMGAQRIRSVARLTTLSALFFCNASLASTSFSPGVQVGTIANSAITEASGIAASRRNSNVLWVHNDSGDTERVFAMTSAGTHLGTYIISSALGADWEDIAIGPGPVAGTQYLYVGAIGDNNAIRSTISVYRVAEPLVSDTQSPVTVTLSGVSKLTFAYPDGARDAESLFVDPLTRDIYIISKRENPKHLYRAAYPQAASGTTTLELMTTFLTDSTWLTAADISPEGNEIIVRSTGNTSGRMYLRLPGGSITDAFNAAPITIPLVSEPQGEAIGFDPLGLGYYTISEGTNRPIYYFNRLPTQGDVNENGVIDAADYVAMRKIDDTQTAYNTWRGKFGETSAAGAASTSVPEPSSGWIIVAGLMAIACCRSVAKYEGSQVRSAASHHDVTHAQSPAKS